jgi:hypothetical protein
VRPSPKKISRKLSTTKSRTLTEQAAKHFALRGLNYSLLNTFRVVARYVNILEGNLQPPPLVAECHCHIGKASWRLRVTTSYACAHSLPPPVKQHQAKSLLRYSF